MIFLPVTGQLQGPRRPPTELLEFELKNERENKCPAALCRCDSALTLVGRQAAVELNMTEFKTLSMHCRYGETMD